MSQYQSKCLLELFVYTEEGPVPGKIRLFEGQRVSYKGRPGVLRSVAPNRDHSALDAYVEFDDGRHELVDSHPLFEPALKRLRAQEREVFGEERNE